MRETCIEIIYRISSVRLLQQASNQCQYDIVLTFYIPLPGTRKNSQTLYLLT
jgi:hypothetical protein